LSNHASKSQLIKAYEQTRNRLEVTLELLQSAQLGNQLEEKRTQKDF